MNKQTITIVSYRSQSELVRAHPDITNFEVVHHAPRGQSTDIQQATLEQKKIRGMVYQVGEFFYQDKYPCACYLNVGDNDQCPKHNHKNGGPT